MQKIIKVSSVSDLSKNFTGLSKEEKLILANMAYEMHLEGRSDEYIAEQLGVTWKQAVKLITFKSKQKKKAKAKRTIEDIRQIEEEVINRMLVRFIPQATAEDNPDKEASYLVLKLLERKHKLLGVDAPQKIETEQNNHITVKYIDNWREKVKPIDVKFTVKDKLKALPEYEDTEEQ
jgi:hypothetical protein